MAGTVVVVAIIAAVVAYAVVSYRKKLAQGCCGAGGDGPAKKIKPQDTNPANYPYTYRIGIEGMTCSGCSTTIQNEFNGHEGFNAKVDLGKRMATVMTKQPAEESLLRKIVVDAGWGYNATTVECVAHP